MACEPFFDGCLMRTPPEGSCTRAADAAELVVQASVASLAPFFCPGSRCPTVVGMVTLNDLMSTVMGELVTPEDEELIVRRDDGSWLIDGHTPMTDVQRALDLDDLATWIAYHGATVTDGALTAYKAVGDDWQTDRKGWVYAPGATVVAEDWDGKPECGGGLHLCLTPSKSRGYYSMATRYVECLIDVTEAVVVDRDKVKARSVRVVREVTIDGEPVTA